MSLGTISEKSSAMYTATLKDETGAIVPGSTLTTLAMWLYDKRTKTVLNNRGVIGGAGQNVLNANNVSVNESGLLTWAMQPADNAIVNVSLEFETHVIVFQATWGTTKGATHQEEFNVTNLAVIS